MEDTIFLRGSSQENKEAKKVLQEHNVDFVEVYSDSAGHQPVLFTEGSVYAYKGLAEIRKYAASMADEVQREFAR